MFSLAKLAYIVCNDKEKWFYDHELETLEIDVKPCCTDLLQLIKNKTDYYGKNVELFYGNDGGTFNYKYNIFI